MKRLLLSTTLAVLALSSAAAFADSGHGKNKQHDRHATHQGHHRDNDRRGDYRRDDRRHDVIHVVHHDVRRDGHHDNGRHLGWQKQAFRRGQRLPAAYLQPRYHVQDYRAYHLSVPQAGYRWVRPENDRYLLVQSTTGLISQMLGY